MKSLNETDIDVALVKLSGMTLFTFALFKLPSAIAAIIQIVIAISIFDWDGDTMGDRLAQQLSLTLTSTAIGNLLAFGFLVFLASWVFRYPKILRKWLEKPEHRFRG